MTAIKIGFTRVSTDSQDLTAQRQALAALKTRHVGSLVMQRTAWQSMAESAAGYDTSRAIAARRQHQDVTYPAAIGTARQASCLVP